MVLILGIYNKNKDIKDSEVIDIIKYTNVKKYEVVYELNKDCDIQDELHEYLIITLTDNTTATFCNTHVDLFNSQFNLLEA